MLFGAGKNPDWDMPLNGIAHWSEEAERRLKTGDDWWYKPQLPPTPPLGSVSV